MVSFSITTIVQDAIKRMRRVRATADDTKKAMRAVALHFRRASREAFASESDPVTGSAWAPLSPNTKSGPPILVESGDLSSSVRFEVRNGEARVFSDVAYGSFHQFGGFRLPQRRFMLDESADLTEVIEIIDRVFEEAIR